MAVKPNCLIFYANDFLEFSYSFAHTYIKNNTYPSFYTYIKNNTYPSFYGLQKIIKNVSSDSHKYLNIIINYLNNLDPLKGFIYNNYCPGGTKKLDSPRMYFSDENGMKIDAIRTKIQERK